MGLDFKAKFTDDGSVGLYSDEFDDIYHSAFGALSEAYEKFILPADFPSFLLNHSEIKILDLCFGIGYNSKAFLNFYFNILKNKNLKFLYENDNYLNSIDTDNELTKNFHKVVLHGVEIDKNLIKLSPLINCSKKMFTNKVKNNIFNFIPNKYFSKLCISEFINIIFLIKILDLYNSDYLSENITLILENKAYKKFFNQNLASLVRYVCSGGYHLTYIEYLLALLHNIYYKYISNSYKKAINLLNNSYFDFKLFNMDARAFIKHTDIEYDFIFLDAFSPSKAPNLWTVEFFKYLYEHLSVDGKILTYSNSASIRHAFLKNGFSVGKIFNKYENRFTGTIATKNKNLINSPLDSYDLGLLNTKAGICYHDNQELSLSNQEILKKRKFEFDSSTLISSTKYKKESKCYTM